MMREASAFSALRHYITRDIIFLIGGGMVVASFLYHFDRLPSATDNLAWYLLLAGIAYVVGYALQDGASLTPFVTTTKPRQLKGLRKWLFERFTRSVWEDVPKSINFEKLEETITEERDKIQLERIIALKQIGTTIGPSSFVTGILIIWKWLSTNDSFDLAMGVTGILLSLLLVGLGWVKAAQQSKFLQRFEDRRRAGERLPSGQ